MVDESKIVKFRGLKFDEVKALSLDEFIALLPSRLRRKFARGLTEQEDKLMKKIRANEKNIKTHCRDMVVLPEMVGLKLSIYNGKEFVQVLIAEEMLGIRLGELAPTRKIGVGHAGMGAKRTVVRK